MEKLSAVIITFNEQRNIRRCLESLLPVADEIVVLDSLSTDDTRRICESYPMVRFFTQPFAGHIEQKNDAVALSTYDLVLSLDADEQLSDELINSIQLIKHLRQHDGYSMNRLTSYSGQWIKHCGWYPDRKVRLFDRNKGRWGGLNPHDKYELFQGCLQGHLNGDLLHYSFANLDELRNQTQKFGQLGAQALFNSGRGGAWIKMFYSPFFRFLRAYVFKAGFLDGKAGIIISWYSAVECFIKYNRLRKLVFSNNR